MTRTSVFQRYSVFPAALYKDAPPFRPHIWDEKSGSPWVDRNITDANCYAYACNDLYRHPEGGFPAPGAKSGSPHIKEAHSYGEFVKCFHGNAQDLIAACESDGLVYAGRKIPEPRDGHYLVAAFVKASRPSSYHWYRLDSNGLWSQKSSSFGGVTNRDADGHLIFDPRAAKRNYDHFVGFFFVPAGGLKTGTSPEPNRCQERDPEDGECLRKYDRSPLSLFTEEQLAGAPHFKDDLWADYGRKGTWFNDWMPHWVQACDSYSYAAGDIYKHTGSGPAWPGQKGLRDSFHRSIMNKAELIDGAMNDGMIYAMDSLLPEPPPGHYLAAAALDAQGQALWFRLDRNGLWSWKTADSATARQTDFSGRPITDPATADRSAFCDFAGYFMVPAGGIKTGFGPEHGREEPIITAHPGTFPLPL